MFKGTINPKYSILIILQVIILAFNWAALHDIVKGNETDYTFEYIFLVLSFIFFVLIIYSAIRMYSKRRVNS